MHSYDYLLILAFLVLLLAPRRGWDVSITGSWKASAPG